MTPPDPAAREAAIEKLARQMYAALAPAKPALSDRGWAVVLEEHKSIGAYEMIFRCATIAHDAAEKRAEEMAARVKVLEKIVIDGLVAVSAAFMQSDAEWREHDKTAARHDAVVRAWRDRAYEVAKSAALAQETPHE